MSVSDTFGSARTSNPPAGAGAIYEGAPVVSVTDTASENKDDSVGMVTIFEPFTDPLLSRIDSLSSALNGAYNDLDRIEKSIAWTKKVYDELGQPINAQTLMWEGPEKITGWPTDIQKQVDMTKQIEQELAKQGKKLDAASKDAYYYVAYSGQLASVTKSEFGSKVLDFNPGAYGQFSGWNAAQKAWYAIKTKHDFPDTDWVRIDGHLYHLEAGGNSKSPGYFSEFKSEFIQNSQQLSLQLFGDRFFAETQRLKAAGLPISGYDAYKYSFNGNTGYTTENQILTRDTTNFSGVADRTIVQVDDQYYLVNGGKGQKLDGPPEGVLMGLPSDLKPQADKRLRDAIAATTDLVQNGLSFTAGDYDMAMYSFGGGQIGYAKMPPVVVSANPQNLNLTSYPPGTLLQYTDEQNKVSYYRVTGTGVIKVEDPSAIAKAVSGNPPDLSSIDPGTLIKLDDGKLYWVTSDQKTMPADGAPLLRFMSPERSANLHGVQVTALLEEAGYVPTDKEADTIQYKDKNDNTIFAKMPPKVFNGPRSEPNGKDYAPGDVIETADRKKAWYIDEQGKVQEARSCVEVKVSGVKEKDFDPAKYNPGDVVGLDNGIYYRITTDHDKKQISYPLERLICNPSDAQISLIKGQLIDLQNSKTANMTTLALRLQNILGQSNNLATMMASIVKTIMDTVSAFFRNMA
ncbi:hypothetical protein [Noviherbaspirillum pedocola]|uniref:Uncharacterized protein n=1 Tax=Noviherbaspirillum pedocola TaxID=2801341 RepID=A0A934VZP9_9BURK|nr:hypothetical protein [Noviherbaspirillum pedocola]MBK4733256.1 hypothetical protein [Noviherbaspirillum pedocola]